MQIPSFLQLILSFVIADNDACTMILNVFVMILELLSGGHHCFYSDLCVVAVSLAFLSADAVAFLAILAFLGAAVLVFMIIPAVVHSVSFVFECRYHCFSMILPSVSADFLL